MSDILFSQEQADRIFDELRILNVSLDADPLSFGPKRLNQKVSDVRRMLERCERVFLDVSQLLHTHRRNLKIKMLELSMKKKILFASDPETRAGKSVSDRDAVASGKLQNEIQDVHALEMAVADLESVMAVIKAKRIDLKDTEGRLRDQLRLCQQELGLGSHWGSKTDKSDIDLTPGIATPADMNSMVDLLSQVDGEINLQKKEGNWTDPDDITSDSDINDLLPPTVTAEAIESFLDVPDVIKPETVIKKVEEPQMDILTCFESDD